MVAAPSPWEDLEEWTGRTFQMGRAPAVIHFVWEEVWPKVRDGLMGRDNQHGQLAKGLDVEIRDQTREGRVGA